MINTPIITQQLESLGLSQNESRIVASLIAQSPASATFIAKECSMSRSSVYTLLNSLISKGFVATTYKNNVKQFTICDFSAIEQYMQNEKDALDKKTAALKLIKNTFETMSNNYLHIPQILLFEGIVGLKRIYHSLLREAKPQDIMYVMRDETILSPEWKFIFEDQWQNIKKEKHIKTKLFLNDSTHEKKQADIYKKYFGIYTNFLPKQNPLSQFTILAINDTVAIMSMKNAQLTGIKITNEHIAHNFKQIFKMLENKKSA